MFFLSGMTKRTLGQVRGELSRLAGMVGLPVTDGRFLSRVNEAIEELMNCGDWPGVMDRWALRMVDGVIILPGHLDRLAGVCAHGAPIELRSGWFEFMQHGPGDQGDGHGWADVVVERGESCLQAAWPGAAGEEWDLQVSGEDGDAGAVVKIQGRDADGLFVSSEVAVAAGGVAVEVDGGFACVSAIIKPVTSGRVALDAVNGARVERLGVYEPGETCPSYRMYFVPSMRGCGQRVVMGRCRRRFVPVREENDVLLISNLRALKAMIMAIEKHDSGNVENLQLYEAYRNSAIRIMADEARAYRGMARTPAMDFSRGAAFGEGTGGVR